MMFSSIYTHKSMLFLTEEKQDYIELLNTQSASSAPCAAMLIFWSD